MQCVAVCYSVLQFVVAAIAPIKVPVGYFSKWQVIVCVRVCVLQRVAECCSVLQFFVAAIVTIKIPMGHVSKWQVIVCVCEEVTQHIGAACCSVLRRVAAYCSVWQLVVAAIAQVKVPVGHDSKWQVIVCCSVLQCVPVCSCVCLCVEDIYVYNI